MNLFNPLFQQDLVNRLSQLFVLFQAIKSWNGFKPFRNFSLYIMLLSYTVDDFETQNVKVLQGFKTCSSPIK